MQVKPYFERMRRLRWHVEVFITLFLARVCLLAGRRRGALLYGAVLGWLAYALGMKVRKRTFANLRIAFPEKSEAAIRAIARDAYKFTARSAFEFIRGGTDDPELLKRRFVYGPGCEEFGAAVRAGQGAILVVGHLGNWEYLAHSIVLGLGLKLNAFAAVQANEVADRIITGLRTRFGARFIAPRMNNSPDMIRAVRRGEIAGFVADQNAGSRGLFVPFMGQIASTHHGPAVYAALTQAPAFFGAAIELEDGRYSIEFTSLGKCSSREQKDVLEFTARWVRVLEGNVRKYPGQYFWMHNRWKSRPKEGSVVYSPV